MNEDDLKKLLDEAPEPPLDELVRLRTRKLAISAFQEAQKNSSADTQDNTETARLTETSSVNRQDERDQSMNNAQPKLHFIRNPVWMTSIAASVALIGVLLVFSNSSLQPFTTVPGTKPSSIKGTAYTDIAKLAPAPGQEVAGKRDLDQVAAAFEAKAPSSPETKMSINAAAPARTFTLEEEMVTAQRIAESSQPGAVAARGLAYSIAPPQTAPNTNRDRFEHVEDNTVKTAAAEPVSTFSIDVDTASYSYVRRQLNRGVMPAEDAVRAEEMINYFDYEYPAPASEKDAFETYVHVTPSPWRKGNKLVHIGIKGYEIASQQQPDSNLVFLLDVSGSMNSADKLPLVKQSIGLLLETLKPTDTVSIVVYAGAAGAVLEPTPVKEKATILAALNKLQAGGSTAGGQGLELAYQLAEINFKKEAVNRIVLATDGDFNVGVTQDERLEDFIARKRDSGIYLSVLGFGEGNYQDALMQTLAQNGNGIAAYIDTLSEAQKIFVDEATRSLFPIANDVKIQVEFNPATVDEYRLIGYETRALNQEDFNNDKVDAGDIGAGHTVTAIYEVTPINSDAGLLGNSRYQASESRAKSTNHELGYLKLRYKRPGEKTSNLITEPIVDSGVQEMGIAENLLQNDVNFSIAVSGFAQLLRGGKYLGTWDYDDVIQLAQANKGDDAFGYRTEFIQLVRKAKIAKAM